MKNKQSSMDCTEHKDELKCSNHYKELDSGSGTICTWQYESETCINITDLTEWDGVTWSDLPDNPSIDKEITKNEYFSCAIPPPDVKDSNNIDENN